MCKRWHEIFFFAANFGILFWIANPTPSVLRLILRYLKLLEFEKGLVGDFFTPNIPYNYIERDDSNGFARHVSLCYNLSEDKVEQLETGR